MKKDFIFESDHFMTPNEEYCAQIRVVILIQTDKCWTPKGEMNVYNWEFLSFYDEDNRVDRNFFDFPEKEQSKLLELAEKLANIYNWEARISS